MNSSVFLFSEGSEDNVCKNVIEILSRKKKTLEFICPSTPTTYPKQLNSRSETTMYFEFFQSNLPIVRLQVVGIVESSVRCCGFLRRLPKQVDTKGARKSREGGRPTNS